MYICIYMKYEYGLDVSQYVSVDQIYELVGIYQ